MAIALITKRSNTTREKARFARLAYGRVIGILKNRYTGPAASEKNTPWEVLLFTVLSARTRDTQTEIVFQALMKRYPTIAALARARLPDVTRILRHIGLYRVKSKNVIALAQRLEQDYAGKVPARLEELVSLPGVGIKTASCVLVYAYAVPAIPVDTHVHRIVNRLGWVDQPTPECTGQALRATVPRTHWMDINRVMVEFGREICVPGRPKCSTCPVRQDCVYPHKTKKPT